MSGVQGLERCKVGWIGIDNPIRTADPPEPMSNGGSGAIWISRR